MTTLACSIAIALPSAESGATNAGRVLSSPPAPGAAPERALAASAYGQPATAAAGEGVCPAARRALRYYRERERYWRRKMGAGVSPGAPPRACPRYLARVARSRARAARARYLAWWRYHYAWWEWLPDKWQRIGACETGYGRRPGKWRWNSGLYQGAFGFYHGSWDAFRRYADPKAGPYPAEAYLATPRQQYEVALAIWRRYGFSGWGCRRAMSAAEKLRALLDMWSDDEGDLIEQQRAQDALLEALPALVAVAEAAERVSEQLGRMGTTAKGEAALVAAGIESNQLAWHLAALDEVLGGTDTNGRAGRPG